MEMIEVYATSSNLTYIDYETINPPNNDFMLVKDFVKYKFTQENKLQLIKNNWKFLEYLTI